MLSLTLATALLRAAGEGTRLRLLVLCAQREWSVTELAASLGQSEPRVSRHLKVLCEAGLLRRMRRGQWVCYSLVDEGDAAALMSAVLSRIDPADPVRRRDAQQASASAQVIRPAVPRHSKLGRALAAFVHDSAPAGVAGSAVVIEPAHLELIDATAAVARRVTLVAARAEVREALREHCDRRGIAADIRARAANASGAWDAAVLDCSGALGAEGVEAALRDIRNRLAPAASLWLVLPYELLEYSRGNVVAHPITELRRVLAAAGFRTEKLKPIDEGVHVLVAHVHLSAHAVSAA
jgi:ArsR family transcriptional regulator